MLPYKLNAFCLHKRTELRGGKKQKIFLLLGIVHAENKARTKYKRKLQQWNFSRSCLGFFSPCECVFATISLYRSLALCMCSECAVGRFEILFRPLFVLLTGKQTKQQSETWLYFIIICSCSSSLLCKERREKGSYILIFFLLWNVLEFVFFGPAIFFPVKQNRTKRIQRVLRYWDNTRIWVWHWQKRKT